MWVLRDGRVLHHLRRGAHRVPGSVLIGCDVGCDVPAGQLVRALDEGTRQVDPADPVRDDGSAGVAGVGGEPVRSAVDQLQHTGAHPSAVLQGKRAQYFANCL